MHEARADVRGHPLIVWNMAGMMGREWAVGGVDGRCGLIGGGVGGVVWVRACVSGGRVRVWLGCG